MTLYRHAHPLFDGQTSVDRVGRTLRVRPADGEAADDRLSFLLWSTLDLTARPEPQKDDKPQTARPTLILETSADGERWLTALTHEPGAPVQLAPIDVLLSFVRIRVAAQGASLTASATLIANAPIALETVRPRGLVVVRSA